MRGIPISRNKRKFWIHKDIKNPNFGHPTVLADTPWIYVELWLKRNKHSSLSYWMQARRFYDIAISSPSEVAPVAAYYMMLNAIKCLLSVKGISANELHGVSGGRDLTAKAKLGNEKVKFHQSGIFPAFCSFLGENNIKGEHSLKEILYNIPFIHRAYSLTYTDPELFLPIEDAIYVRHPNRHQSEAWFEARVNLTVPDKRYLKGHPSSLEVYEQGNKIYVRSKKRFYWKNYETCFQ